MPTSYRETIIAEVIRRLKLIGSSGSYASTVTPTVLRTPHPSQALPQLPCLFVGAISETYERVAQSGAVGVYSRTLTLSLDYVFVSQSPDTDASKCIHDVELALASHTLTNASNVATCNDVRFISNETSVGSLEQPLATVTLVVEVDYGTEDDDPATRVL
jgi:hypothetical protein